MRQVRVGAYALLAKSRVMTGIGSCAQRTTWQLQCFLPQGQEVLGFSLKRGVITVRQVLVGAHALLANGGVMTGVGCHLTALAAKRHAVPFVVLVGLHKLSPLFPHDPALTFNDFKVSPCPPRVPLPIQPR